MATKPGLSISFHNFYQGFDPARCFLVRELATRYSVTLDAAGRDVQVSGVFGTDPLPSVRGGRPLRVWWTAEAQDPKAAIFDLYLGFAPSSILGRRWLRVPNWIACVDWWDPTAPNAIVKLTGNRVRPRRQRFCTFVASNNPTVRTEFFLRLNEARPVDSLGRYLNNRGRYLPDRRALLEAQSEARFNIAFENQISPGYVTEKLVNPLLAGSVPIYWGAPEAVGDFNAAAFVNANEFASLDDLVRHVIALDDHPEAVAELAAATPLPGDNIRYELSPAFAVEHIEGLLSSGGAARVPVRWIEQLTQAEVRRPWSIRLARKIVRMFPMVRATLRRLFTSLR